ncbi:AraC family transcriptional regulator [Streptomyces sp. NPDC002680]|uniref:helix-turn-helix transcriptional regulator n=1 Tax=Streptomyces sp. NPDC002680 TaxID=3364659 RepID=UPI0036AC1638
MTAESQSAVSPAPAVLAAPSHSRSSSRHVRQLPVDHMPVTHPTLHVTLFENASFVCTACPVPSPHRHAFHELIWTESGTGHHLLDGERSVVGPNTVMLVERGQIHHFEQGQNLSGAIVCFGDELLHDGPASSANLKWLFTGSAVPAIEVPAEDAARVGAVIHALAEETRRPTDTRSADVYRHLLLSLLLWVERWHEHSRPHEHGQDESDVVFHRRFRKVLERDFTRHHEVGHYADELGVTPGALWRTLSRATGSPPRVLITERVMLEAARLLRFTELTVGEIAARIGVNDPLYLSRAFKRHYGESPLAYRDRLPR